MRPAFTFDNYLNLPARGKAFFNTLTLAPLATLFTAVVAFPMAYFLAVKADRAGASLLLVLVMAPFWTSQLLRYYAWIMILGSKGIPSWLAVIGIADLRIINTPWAVLIGAVYGFLPLMVPPIYVSLEKLDKRLLEASADLGATPLANLPAGDVADVAARRRHRLDARLHPADGRLHPSAVPRRRQSLLHRQCAGRSLPAVAQLAVRRGGFGVRSVAIMFVTIFLYMRFVLGMPGSGSEALV